MLITDGEDTCAPPDPCEVARELAAQGTHLVVDTLGLAPDEKVRQQLLCIATATGGTYTAAQSADELTGRIKQLVDRAKDTYTADPGGGGRRRPAAPRRRCSPPASTPTGRRSPSTAGTGCRSGRGRSCAPR